MDANSIIQAVLGLSLAVMFWPGMAGAAEPSRWALLAVVPPAMLFFTKIRMTTTHWLALALMVWTILSMAWASVFDDALNGMLEFAFCFAVFAIAAEIEEPGWFYSGAAIGLGVSTGIAMGQRLGYEPVITQFVGSGPSGLFVNPSILGESAVCIAVLMLARKQWWLTALVLPGLLLSQQRSSLIALICCITAMVWLWKRWLAIGALVFCGAAAMVLADKSLTPWDSLAQRIDIWRDALTGVTFFGHGIGNFYAVFPFYENFTANEQGPAWPIATHAHNDLLEVLFELGVPGFVLTCAMAWSIWKHAQLPERYGLAAIGITSLAGFPLHMPFTGAVAAYMAGVAVGGRGSLRGTQLHRGSGLYLWRKQPSPQRLAEGVPAIPA